MRKTLEVRRGWREHDTPRATIRGRSLRARARLTACLQNSSQTTPSLAQRCMHERGPPPDRPSNPAPPFPNTTPTPPPHPTQERSCSKAYVALVTGRFPSPEAGPEAGAQAGVVVVDVPLSWDPKTNHAQPVGPGVVRRVGGCFGHGGWPQPRPPPLPALTRHSLHPACMPAVPPSGCSAVDPALAAQAKHAVTEFRLLHASPDGATSVVECRCVRGGACACTRTHAASRVHGCFGSTVWGAARNDGVTARSAW
jgi:hypothetical protein